MSTDSRQDHTLFGVRVTRPWWMASPQVSTPATEPDFDCDDLDGEFDPDDLYEHFPRP
ncbi:hypothetical protein [Actinoplanes couchii]|uniref:Uncharacterized protein n=1 Tax=Actinoplanes couchii TaxID=403638 RepID=A0ABQ3XGZ2_9ACTN|nr:hypothetical protein [Actinoplanes couchii]MDR6320744.1 hypothetical protein [Actinoplanes couchii]GID57770.1 hypothetical protein Aco03nite_061740 [Actinoplanes couchii]